MPRKAKIKKTKSNIGFKNGLNEELKDVEKWVHERRKFFTKLAWILIFITLLIIISNFYLKVKGVGLS